MTSALHESSLFTFHGTPSSVSLWKERVESLLGRKGSAVVSRAEWPFGGVFTIPLNKAEAGLLMDRLWYAPSGTGEAATGRPYRWNDCVTFSRSEIRETVN